LSQAPFFTITTSMEAPGLSMPRTRPWNFRSIPILSIVATKLQMMALAASGLVISWLTSSLA
jgi:hypothetical protein